MLAEIWVATRWAKLWGNANRIATYSFFHPNYIELVNFVRPHVLIKRGPLNPATGEAAAATSDATATAKAPATASNTAMATGETAADVSEVIRLPRSHH